MYIGLPHTMDKHTFPFNPFSLKSIARQIVGHSLHFLLSSSFLLYIIPHPRSSSSRIPSPKGYSASILQPPQSPHIFVSNNFLPSLPLSFYHSHPSLFPLPFSSPLLVYVFVTCDRNISRDDICALTQKPQSVRFMCLPPMSQCLSSQEASGCCRLFIPIYPLSI